MLWLISVFLSMKYFAVSTTVYRLCNEGVTQFKAFKKQKQKQKKPHHFNDAGPLENSKAHRRQQVCLKLPLLHCLQ